MLMVLSYAKNDPRRTVQYVGTSVYKACQIFVLAVSRMNQIDNVVPLST